MGFDKENAFVSGEPGTTGREPFEQDNTGSFGNSGNTGLTGNTQSGQHHHHHQHGEQGRGEQGQYGSSGLGDQYGSSGREQGQQGQYGSSGLGDAGQYGSSGREQGQYGSSGQDQGQFGSSGQQQGQFGSSGQQKGQYDDVPRDAYGPGSGSEGQGGRFDQTGNTKADSGTGATHHQGHGHHHHHQSGEDVGSRGQQGSGLAGSGYDSTQGTTTGSSNYESDRVGSLGQQSGAYERTGADGPVTHGAAGTDRFDSDRSHGNAASGAGFGPGGERHTEYGGNTASGYGGENDVDKRQKAEGTGGIGGILGTTDKEFTGRDRLGGASGAYGDDAGQFKGNTSGPSGNTALTGREGTYDNNPVAQAESKAGNEVHPTRTEHGASTTHGTGTGTDAEGTAEKKGIFEKIKDALH